MFLARTVPASRSAKPHCMKKTRKPQSESQNMSASARPNLVPAAALTISPMVELSISMVMDILSYVCANVRRDARRQEQ